MELLPKALQAIKRHWAFLVAATSVVLLLYVFTYERRPHWGAHSLETLAIYYDYHPQDADAIRAIADSQEQRVKIEQLLTARGCQIDSLTMHYIDDRDSWVIYVNVTIEGRLTPLQAVNARIWIADHLLSATTDSHLGT